MRERPILFSGAMVRAILDGRKSRTSRVIKPQPNNMDDDRRRQSVLSDSPYQVGDLLWVRETHYRWTGCGKPPATWVRSPEGDIYDARGYVDDGENDALYERFAACVKVPSIYMPNWATRIWLRVTGVRVERVQEVTPTDCEYEGISGVTLASPVRGQPYGEYRNGDGIVYTEPKAAFHALWDSLNAKRGYGWDKNPWVRAVRFEREQAR